MAAAMHKAGFVFSHLPEAFVVDQNRDVFGSLDTASVGASKESTVQQGEYLKYLQELFGA
jgi:hypothetical protein